MNTTTIGIDIAKAAEVSPVPRWAGIWAGGAQQ
jgi:hypothetical protein